MHACFREVLSESRAGEMKAWVHDCGVRETSQREMWKLTKATKRRVTVLITAVDD